MLTEHTRFALLKKIGAYIRIAGRNKQGLQEQKQHTGIIRFLIDC